MQPEVDNFLKFLPDRLADCAKKAGGKRALALATHISEAQLFRYISGKSEIPVNRLVAIALAAKVSPAWLLTGDAAVINDEPNRPPLREALLVNITQVLEELLIEYEKNFTPAQRAQAINFMYKALRHEEILRDVQLTITKPLMLGFVNFLVDIKNEDILIALNHAIDFFEYSAAHQHIDYAAHAGEFSAFVNYITRACEHYYNSASGQAYFDRLGTQILPTAAKRLDDVVAYIQKRNGYHNLTCLDLGCGNGRELSYLHRHYAHFTVHGIDQSGLAVSLCAELSQKDLLPAGAVIKGNVCTLPYKKEQFDLVLSRQTLFLLPYLPHSGLGAEAMLHEIHRTLKQNGHAYIMSRLGEGREYLPFCEHYSAKKFAALCAATGFKVLWFKPYDLSVQKHSKHLPTGNRIPVKFENAFHALIVKV